MHDFSAVLCILTALNIAQRLCPEVSKVFLGTKEVIYFVFLFAPYLRKNVFGKNFACMGVLVFLKCLLKGFLKIRMQFYKKYLIERGAVYVLCLKTAFKKPRFLH